MKLLFAFLVISVFVLPRAWADEVNGVMMVVKGDVKVTAAKDGKTEPAKIGRKVFAGDTITAGPDSRAKIVMSDKNILNISPDSKIKIEKYTNDQAAGRNVELKVEYGKVRATVEQKYDGDKNKFNIKTPTAVAGVRGTDFITGFNAANRQTSVITFSGMVAVGTPGPGGQIQNPVFVRPGQTTNVNDGKTPEPPKALPKEDLNQMNSDSSADANAGKKDQGQQTAAQGDNAEKSEKKDEAPKSDANARGEDASAKKEDNSAKKDDAGPKQENKEAKKDDSKSNNGSDNAAAKSENGNGNKDAKNNEPKGDGGPGKNDGKKSADNDGKGPDKGPAPVADNNGNPGKGPEGKGPEGNPGKGDAGRRPASAGPIEGPGPSGPQAGPVGPGPAAGPGPAPGTAPVPGMGPDVKPGLPPPPTQCMTCAAGPGPVPTTPMLPPVPTVLPPTMYMPPPTNTFINNAIRNGKVKTTIQIIQQ
jgi:hypothetical protein